MVDKVLITREERFNEDTTAKLADIRDEREIYRGDINRDGGSVFETNSSEIRVTIPFQQEESSKFLWLSKRFGVSGFNVSTYFMLQMAASLATTFMNTFLIYIVKDPEYYNVKKEDAG